MLKAALLINIGVLVPVIIGLIKRSRWTIEAYGNDSPAKRILLSVYLSILILSLLLLRWPSHDVIVTLLLLQILYKVTTPLTVRNWKNPVVIGNLLIAGFHILALWMEGATRTVNWMD